MKPPANVTTFTRTDADRSGRWGWSRCCTAGGEAGDASTPGVRHGSGAGLAPERGWLRSEAWLRSEGGSEERRLRERLPARGQRTPDGDRAGGVARRVTLGWGHATEPQGRTRRAVPHLHPDRRRRQTALADGSRAPKTDQPAGRLRRRGGGQLRDRRGHRPGPARAGADHAAAPHPERAVRRGRGPGQPDHRPTRPTRRCGSTRATSSALEEAATGTTTICPCCAASCCPGGHPAAALLHTARTVTRRAERSAWAAGTSTGRR